MDKNKVQNYIQTGTGITAGFYAYKYGLRPIYKVPHKLFWKLRGETPQANIEQIKNAGLKHIDDYKMHKDPKLKLVDLGKINYDQFINDKLKTTAENFDKKIGRTTNPIKKWLLKRKKKKTLKHIPYLNRNVLEGKNGYFTGSSKQIVINMQKGPEILFHELGHLINNNEYKPLCKLRNLKALQVMPLAILGTSLLTNSKPNDQKEKNKFQNAVYKTCAFIKNNCGKLMTMTLIPLVMEEGVASLHGQRNAKNYLDKVNLKYVTKSHLHSFASYSAFAATTGLTMFFANKIRDIIAETNFHQLKNNIISIYRKTAQKT